ncbi:MAG: phosphoribosylamine--glycine ligase [Bacteroidetes bacterium]|nr:phosphoribosylamine--glycine ligase [Bacteroidota bacterium]MCL5026381.1 phosphoribosylamine--glycine ligase [Chloroflexota bacterium]
MNILVIGSGAREHALAWKLAQSPLATGLFCAPGNAGTAQLAENVPISAEDVPRLAEWAQARGIDLTVVGPESPLTAGIVDVFQARGLRVFGPSKAAAAIEGSKVWAKELMWRYGIPTASGAVFASYDEARRYLAAQSGPIVVKADGLAAGKGVIVAQTQAEAQAALSQIMQQRAFGAAGDRVVIEECLAGLEVSLLALTDGAAVRPMAPACDYKRVYDGDRGPNTGGMGSYCPPGFVTEAMVEQITARVLEPAVRAMAAEGIIYRGVLYAGLMLTHEGPKVLEFNARFGDPETQVILPRLDNDLVALALACIDGTLHKETLRWHEGACCGVVLASGGYPGSYRTGFPILGLDALDADGLVFHAGTRLEEGRAVTAGGRVLTVAAKGRTMEEARARAYDNAARVCFEGVHYRRDIAEREVG